MRARATKCMFVDSSLLAYLYYLYERTSEIHYLLLVENPAASRKNNLTVRGSTLVVRIGRL